MSISTSTSTESLVVPESRYCEDLADFVRWGASQLHLSLREEDGISVLKLGEADQSVFDGNAQISLALGATAPTATSESIDLDDRFARWLLRRLQSDGRVIHVRPRDQPTAVNDISQRLFAAYQVDHGRVHLGGCQLTDYPFLRLSFAAVESERPVLRHIFMAHDGSSVADPQVEELGLLDLELIADRTPRIDDAALRALEAAGRRAAAQTSTSRDPMATSIASVFTSVVWVKHASGTLNFTIGDQTVQLPFSGWAKLVKAQPYVAAHSGASTFHLAATDEGKIDALDQIELCEQSGRRVLRQELVVCSVTGKSVLEEFTRPCPVSGKPTLIAEFATCTACRQRVSKATLKGGLCGACRNLVTIRKDDPRLVWILGEHGGLDRWKRWQLAETQNDYIAVAIGLIKRLLVVVDKETLEVRHVATSGRFSVQWTPVAGPAQAELLN